MADMCSMVHLVCLFMKTYLLALLQDNCLDLVHCAFLRKLYACVSNIIAVCQHLLRPIKWVDLADTDILVIPKLARPIYRSISTACTELYLLLHHIQSQICKSQFSELASTVYDYMAVIK